MKLQLRRKTQTFMENNRFRGAFCIEIKKNGRWTFLGDDNGILKFKTAEERDAKMEELMKEHA